MIAISNIPEKGQLQLQKNVRLVISFCVNNAKTCEKTKNALDLMVAVYCHCLVQLKIVFVRPDSLL